MESNIDVSLINKQLIQKRHESNNNHDNDHNDDNLTKIVPYHFFTINEINITSKINKIPYYSNQYNVMIDYDFIDISKIDEKIVENMDLMENKKYIICHYNNEKRINFQDFLFNMSDIKQFMLNILTSYSNLLNSLIILNEQNICFFGLNTFNIVFSNNRPFLDNFQNSLDIYKLNESYITNIIKNIYDYTYKPLEIHVLFYLIIYDESSLSLSFIEYICTNYVQNMSILSLFSQQYKDSYEKACVESLKKYINMSKSAIINDILKYYEYWDNYSLTIIYLHIIGHITRIFSLKGTFLNKFSLLLVKNIHPNPLKRETLKNTIKKYEELFKEFVDWSFINNIPNEKLTQLYNVLLN
jgi:hypothetical protein